MGEVRVPKSARVHRTRGGSCQCLHTRDFGIPLGLSAADGASRALKGYCFQQPAGYREGPDYAVSRRAYVEGCRELSAKFQYASVELEEWRVCPEALDVDLLSESNPYRLAPLPHHCSRPSRAVESLGIGLSLFRAILAIAETPSFERELSKLDLRMAMLWQRRKAVLARSVDLKSLGFQRWRPGGPECYSVRLDGSYRVHLRRDPRTDTWCAESVGDHKAMGHG